MKAKSRGFTIIEILVVVVILGILTALVGPSFVQQMAKRRVQGAASDVASDLRLARSEAVKRSSYVTVCRSTDAATCAAADGSWHTGWVVFLDRNGNAAIDGGDTVLRVHQELTGIASMGRTPNAATTRGALTFRPNGLGVAIDDTWMITPSGGAVASMARLMCISAQGRLTLLDKGATAC